ncbi:MAG: ATP-binding protein [Bacteroidaceae bacterium]|nr:ATP-binding protein [Bacteroidaceae bacterium]
MEQDTNKTKDLAKGALIKEIEIEQLWSGQKHIRWQLNPQVNVLSGINGVGKSTILNKIIRRLSESSVYKRDSEERGVRIVTEPEDASLIRFDIIRSFDRPLLSSDALGKLDRSLLTELDCQLFNLQRRYLDYQVNIGNRIIQALQSGSSDAASEAQKLSAQKQKFQDLVDDLFAETGKKLIRTENEIRFSQIGEVVLPTQLSSGEKQILCILLTVLVEDMQPYVLLMDEPEVSLHVDWQERLIEMILALNPNVQIILTTHSPAVIMKGWMDSVTNVEDIVIA